jgi:tellurite resistance protein TerC
VDSIPAIFAVTEDPFLVYTSNVFAILGLRSLYFLLAGVIHKFHYLKLGLSVVLVFVGAKMLLTDIYKVPVGLSLGVIALILLLSVVASLVFPKSTEAHSPVEHDPLGPIPEDAVAPIEADDEVMQDVIAAHGSEEEEVEIEVKWKQH